MYLYWAVLKAKFDLACHYNDRCKAQLTFTLIVASSQLQMLGLTNSHCNSIYIFVGLQTLIDSDYENIFAFIWMQSLLFIFITLYFPESLNWSHLHSDGHSLYAVLYL